MNTEIAKAREENVLLVVKPAEQMRLATDVAGVCREIVKRTAIKIKGRHYVKVEGWQSIATAHGCVAGTRDVEPTETGIRAIGELRRADTGELIATAEGFVGDDEKMWQSRNEFAKRAMAQTRAISRVCRSAFAHVVVLIDANLSTTPAEEMSEEDISDVGQPPPARSTREVLDEAAKRVLAGAANVARPPSEPADWQEVAVAAKGPSEGRALGELNEEQLEYLLSTWVPARLGKAASKPVTEAERAMIDALMQWKRKQKPNPMTAEQFQAERERQQRELAEEVWRNPEGED